MAKVMHSLSRMTLSPNIVHGGIKVNVIAAKAYFDVDIRTLLGEDEEYVISHLKKALGSLAREATIESLLGDEGGLTSFGNASPASSEFVNMI
jgi:acetylornithine deacetylase/succinyl-diaminopimelate desuccinylase-like protein